MQRHRFGAGLALAGTLALLLTTPAFGATTLYYVQGTGDSPIAGCAPIEGVPVPAARCDTLRAAVTSANANFGGEEEFDVIFLQAAGTYQLAQGELSLTDSATIVGRGPRTTEVAGTSSTRVFSVGQTASVGLTRLAVRGGQTPSEEGGNILNAGSLFLSQVQVTGGFAQAGGGIANYGVLGLSNSLVDHNSSVNDGGGILNRGVDGGAGLSISNSTIAFNSITGTGGGAGIASTGSSDNFTVMTHSTVARNQVFSGTAPGIYAATPGDEVTMAGSIVASNTPQGNDCLGDGTFSEAVASTNITNIANNCNFARLPATIVLGEQLTNQGGDTDVLTIDPLSAAKGIVATCSGGDQRDAPRPASNCDAGAFQEGAVAPPIDSGPEEEPVPQPPVPTPTPAPPVPTPTPTPPVPTPTPTPEFGRTVVVEPVDGTVLVCPTRPTQCTPLRAGDDIPFGATVDTKKGTVELTSLSSRGGKPQTAEFSDGIFKVVRSGTVTELQLTEPLDCSQRGRAAQKKKPKTRKLWGDGKGKFRTKGQYSAATIRGTKWLVQDTCTTTLTRVTQGSVTVRDLVKRKNVVVRKGKRYTARARR